MDDKTLDNEPSNLVDLQGLLVQKALHALPLSFNVKNSDGQYRFVNAHQARNAGLKPEEIVGQETGVAGGEIWRRVVRERDLHVLKTGEPLGPFRDDFAKLFGLDGHWVTFKAPFSFAEGGDLDHIATISFDVTPFVEAENRLRVAAYTDALTGLPNRRWFDRELDQMAAKLDEGKSSSDWLLVVDIDHFKSVNDNFGHPAGDEVLREAGLRLRQAARSCDTPARIGGEEFVVVVSDATADEALDVAERIRSAFQCKPMTVVDSEPTITVSIGAAPINKGENGTALKCADRALYLAKEAGRNRVVFAQDCEDTPLLASARK